jgi:hypothetical protein
MARCLTVFSGTPALSSFCTERPKPASISQHRPCSRSCRRPRPVGYPPPDVDVHDLGHGLAASSTGLDGAAGEVCSTGGGLAAYDAESRADSAGEIDRLLAGQPVEGGAQ